MNPIEIERSALPKYFYLTLGWLCVAFGGIGIFLPLLPTTPFLLVAAWAFAKSSPRFREWLVNHHRFGPYITDWQRDGAIPLRGKILALAMMSLSMVWLIAWSNAPHLMIWGIGAVLLTVAVFILTRPTTRR